MKVFGVIVGTILIAFGVWLVAWPTGMSPVAYFTPPNPGLAGPYQTNTILQDASSFDVGGAGPEDLVLGVDDQIYVALQDGRIVRFPKGRPDDLEGFANTNGRPTGVDVDADGNLIVADNKLGLLKIDSLGKITVLVDSFDGKKLLFVNDVSVAPDGRIWFTDSSQRFPHPLVLMDFLEGRSTGRLFSFDPQTGLTKIHLEALRMANGVAVGPKGDYILICETFGYRVIKYWVTGDRIGTTEPLIENLPAMPDNITFNGENVFWLALVARRHDFYDSLSDRPLLREAIYRATGLVKWTPNIEPFGWVIGVDPNGIVSHNFQDPDGTISRVSSANEIAGRLYLGSQIGSEVAVVDLLAE